MCYAELPIIRLLGSMSCCPGIGKRSPPELLPPDLTPSRSSADGYADPGRPQSSNQGGQLPVTVRDRSPQPQAAGTPAIAARHVRGGPSLVDDDQAVGIERGLAADEHPPGLGDIRAVLLGRV